MSTTVRLLVDVKNEKPAYEEVHVEDCGSATYRLLQSPGLVLGLAAGDVLVLEQGGTFTLVERGRNICIQIFSKSMLDQIEQAATSALARIGGRLDGKASVELVYTVSANVGFPAIEEILRDLQARFPVLEWYYGNVYDPADGVTPLNWW
jgi:hypothetical protein